MSNEVSLAEMKGPLGELCDQCASKVNGRARFQEFLLWLKRVGQTILVSGINRSLSNEQAVEAGGRVWYYKIQAELDTAPRYDGGEAEIDFVEFDHDPLIAEVNAIYTDGWVADLVAVAKYMQDKPEAADDRPVAIQWAMRADGTAAYAFWDRDDSERRVEVDRDGYRWSRRCRFARVRSVRT